MERLRDTDIGLTVSWHVSIHDAAEVPRIKSRAAPLLNALATAGVDSFNAVDGHVDPRLDQLIHQLDALDVADGFVMPGEVPPRVFAGTFGSGWLDPDELTSAVEGEASKPDNRRKLSDAPPGARRHLFVWLHDSNWYVAVLLRDPMGPSRAPVLPEVVDVVWAAVGPSPAGSPIERLMRCNRGGEWEEVPTVESLPRGCLASLVRRGK
jgi:hypothetical protein